MGDRLVTAGIRAATTVSDQTELSPTGEVLRDIARGGISGAIRRRPYERTDRATTLETQVEAIPRPRKPVCTKLSWRSA